MKWMALSVLFAVACTKSTVAPTELATTAPAPAAPAADAALVMEIPDDGLADILPVGTFADVATLCMKQEQLVVPHLEAISRERTNEEPITLKAACIEDRAMLKDTHVALNGSSFLDVSAIQLETGTSTDTFLVVKTAEGWTAIRRPVLSLEYDDPGCVSIERATGILDVRATSEGNALVVQTQAERGYYEGEVEHTVVSTRERTCSLTMCGNVETVDTKDSAVVVSNDSVE